MQGGNLYVADKNLGTVSEILAANGIIPLVNPTINTLASGFNAPQAVAVDAAGNVFVADLGNDAVKKILAVGGSIPANNPTINTIYQAPCPTGVAVDTSGNVYVAAAALICQS